MNKTAPVVTWATPAAISYGTALSSTQLNATATGAGGAALAGTFTYSPAAGAVLSAGAQTLSVTFTPTDTADYSAATQTVVLQVNKAAPVVTWATPAAISYGTALSTAQLNATATGAGGAALAGTFTYSPASGAVLSTGAQTLSVTFTPTDTADYSVATQTVSLQVNKTVPVVTWATPAAITYGTALSSAQLNATATGASGAMLAGTFVYSPSSGAVLSVGTQTLSVTFTPTDTADYSMATQTVSLQVNKVASVLTWATPAAITYGTALSSMQLNAAATGSGGATLAGTFAYSPAAGAVLSAGVQPLSVTFTPTDTTDYSVATQTVSLQVNKAAPVLTWATPAAISYGTALSSMQLNAAATGSGGATLAGTFAYSPAAGAVLSAGAQTLSVTFTPTDTADYSAATQTVVLQVNKAAPVVTWATPAAISYGTALSTAQLNATATGAGGAALAGTFTYSPASGAVLSAGAQTLSVTFTPTDTADYSAATQTVVLQVNISAQTITFATLPGSVVYGASAIQLSATASSGLPVSYAVTGPASLSGTSLTVTGTGTVMVTATEAGDANYSAAPAVTQSFTVTPRQLTATVTGVSLTYGQPAPTITGTLTGVLAKDAGSVGAVYSTPATSASAVGTYPITVTLTGPAAADYSVQLAASGSGAGAGAVTVTPAPLKVTVNNATRAYGLANPAFTGTIAGVVNNDQITVAYSSAATTTSPTGTYSITATLTGAALGNYSPAISDGTLTVTGGTLTVTANDASRLYGLANPSFTGSISGAQSGDMFTESFNTQATLASPAGAYVITPVVAGANLASYTVNTVPGTLTVNRAPSSVVLSSTAASIGTGASLTFTAVVTPSTSGLPTGTVSFYDGTTVMGSSTLVGGTASYTTSFSAGGLHPITAAYSGDGNFLASASAVTTETAIAATYTLTAGASGITVRQGASGGVKLTVQSVGNYIGHVEFACSGLPAQATCSVDPSSLTFSGNSNASQTATLTLQTLSPEGITGELHMPGSSPRARGGPVLAAMFWLPGALLAGFIAVRRRSLTVRMRQLLVLVVMAACVLAASGCSGKFFTPTPLGTSTITVTAGPAANQRVTFMLTVN